MKTAVKPQSYYIIHQKSWKWKHLKGINDFFFRWESSNRRLCRSTSLKQQYITNYQRKGQHLVKYEKCWAVKGKGRLRGVMTLGWCRRWISQAGREKTIRVLWHGWSCPGMRLGGPDPARRCLSWAVMLWESVLETVAEDVEKREGLLRLLKKKEWSREQ